MGRLHRLSALLPGLALLLATLPARAGHFDPIRFEDGTGFMPALGFEWFVPPVLSSDGTLLVYAEETRTGSSARLTALRLEPDTGEPLRLAAQVSVPGFVPGVPPTIHTGSEMTVIVAPFASRNGSGAGIQLVYLNPLGDVIEQERLTLGDLTFRERWSRSLARDGLYYLETPDQSGRALLIVDPRGQHGRDRFSLFTFRDEDFADRVASLPWLPPLAPRAEPLYLKRGRGGTIVFPAATKNGLDVLVFDLQWPPPSRPVRLSAESGDEEFAFDRFAPKVDLLRLGGTILVPVERDGSGDLLCMDLNGRLLWALADEADRLGLRIPAYTEGAGIGFVAGSSKPPCLYLTLEASDGSGADIWGVDVRGGTLAGRVDDLNPGLDMARFVPGIGLSDWTFRNSDGRWRVPIVHRDGTAGILLLRDDLLIDAAFSGPPLLGYIPWTQPGRDYIPVGAPNGSDFDIVYFGGPHLTSEYSLEEINPPLVIGPLVREVPPVMVSPGGHLFVPEEDPATGEARLRIEESPVTTTALAVATQSTHDAPGSLLFFDYNTGRLLYRVDDVLGLETGVSLIAP